MQPFVHAFVSCRVAEGQALRFMASLTEMFVQSASLPPPPPACTAKSTPMEDRGFFGAFRCRQLEDSIQVRAPSTKRRLCLLTVLEYGSLHSQP